MPDEVTDSESDSPKIGPQEPEKKFARDDASAIGSESQDPVQSRRPRLSPPYAIVVAIGSLMILIVFLLSNDVNPFRSKLHIKAYFDNASGLREGSEVLIAGVRVGRVNSVTLIQSSSLPRFRVAVLMSVSSYIDGTPTTEIIRNRLDSPALSGRQRGAD
jgi:hypothetical protein